MFFENNNFRNFEDYTNEIPGLDFMKANLKSTIYYEQQPMTKNSKFISPKDGLMRGNLIADEYEPYKNYTFFRLIPKTEREVLLFKVYEYDFAINDLNLYLDLNPNDSEALSLFKKYVNEFKKAKEKYESVYGPLTLTSADFDTYKWSSNPWPWENDGGSAYV